MPETALAVRPRSSRGKGAARRLRAQGRLPAVLYGPKLPALPLDLETRTLEHILRNEGSNTLLRLEVEGRGDLDQTMVLVRELQRHPVQRELLHADFVQIDLSRAVEVAVPLHLIGKARGVELGGVLDPLLREITVRCLPRAIPEALEVDVSPLGVGDVLHVRDLTLPPDVELVIDPDLGAVHVIAPTVASEEEPAEVTPVETEAAPGQGEGS